MSDGAKKKRHTGPYQEDFLLSAEERERRLNSKARLRGLRVRSESGRGYVVRRLDGNVVVARDLSLEQAEELVAKRRG